MPATVAKLPYTGPALLTSLASNGAPRLSARVTTTAPRTAAGQRARTGAGRASSSLAPSSKTPKTTIADPSTAKARSASGTPGSAVTTTVSAPTASAPSSSAASIANTRTYRDANPARRRLGTAATWFSVRYAEKTTPVPANSKPIKPAMNGTVDVGKVVTECS